MKRRTFLGLLGVASAAPVVAKAAAAAPEEPLAITMDEFAEEIVGPHYERQKNSLLTPTEVSKQALRILQEKLVYRGPSPLA